MDGALDELALEGIELPAPMLEVLKRGGKVLLTASQRSGCRR